MSYIVKENEEDESESASLSSPSTKRSITQSAGRVDLGGGREMLTRALGGGC